MAFSVIAIGDVQNVLSAMQKNLECPICLDVVEEPVSTKCDHIFCRFCMFRLLSKKKKGVIQCPLCKTEVTKRSLKENSRFKQLIEGLLETIHAFELDTEVKFLSSHHFPKTSSEAGAAAEFLCKESSVIQSKGFRNRKKSAKENGQENHTLEANVDTQLTGTKVKRCPLRNKTQKCDSEKGIYIEFGSDSSEELFKQASKTGLEDKEALQMSSQEKPEDLKSSEKENEYSCNAQPDKLDAKDIIPPNVVGESDFAKEDLSKKSAWSITEYGKPGQVNMTEYQSSPLNVLSVDLLIEQCGRTGNATPLGNGDISFFKNTEEMDAEQTHCNSKSEEFYLKDGSESRLDKSREIDIAVQSVEAVEMCEPENDSSHENKLPLEKLLQPETLHSPTLNQVSGKRLKRSIQKVNEWFSKSNEILSSNSSQDDSARAADVSGEGDMCLSDKDSCISEKTDVMVDSMEIAVVEGNKRRSKQTADSIKDKIFGKTYKRERKSDPCIILTDILPTTKKEDVAANKKCLNNSSRDRLKRKRKTACFLQPEDFIKKKHIEKAGGCPQSVNQCLGDAEKKRCDRSSVVNESRLSENREDNTLAELEKGGGSVWKKATEKMTIKGCHGELQLNNCHQKSTKKSSSAVKRCRRSTRTMCALQLVADRNSVSPDAAESQIDSYPSSEELRKADSKQRQVRRSRRLQLLAEEMTEETEKGVVIQGARKCDSDHEGSFSGVQRNVLAHTSECKDLCEHQGKLSYKPFTNLKGGYLEANEIQISLKNSSDTAETGKTLFNPTSSYQHSNCSSFGPDAGSQAEIPGSPFFLQFPMTVVQSASHLSEEMTESCTIFPKDSGHNAQNVPGAFETENLPMTKNMSKLTKEAEDSDLDTQYLRNIFRHSKRLSFSLYPTPVKTCTVEDAASETVKISCADWIENKHSKCLETENVQGEKTTRRESLSRVCEKEKLKTYESACVSPVPCFVGSTDCMHTGEHQEDVSQVTNQGNLTQKRMATARTEDKNRLQKGEQGNEKTVSTDIGIESELRQNPMKSIRSQSDQSNAEGHVFKRTDLNTVNEICFSSEKDQAIKAKVVDSKGQMLDFQSRSMICPTTCQQRPAEFSCEVTGKKSSKRERKQVTENEEQATQTASTGMSECSVTEALEEPLKENSDFTGLSETPDGLLCSNDDIEENASFSVTDRRERSAVFVKRSDNALVNELHNKSVSSEPRSKGIQRSRRRARKLQSSDEESSEDEDLPCLQTLIFGESASTPLHINKQMTSVIESSVSPIALPHSGSHNDNVQKMPEGALSNECVSPSQESECSINLFSSQSNVSEELVDGAQELKKPLIQVHTSKQVSNVNESKETFQSCNGGLKRSKTNFKDECQEDPNVGANLGEASGYDSETSNVEDLCGPFSQGEILSTQQKNAMQNNLKKLQQEMAELEAVLKQHGSEDCEFLPIHSILPHSSREETLGMEQRRQERGVESTSEENFENHKCCSSKQFSANDVHVLPSDSLNSKIKVLEKERSPELSLPSSKSCLLKRPNLEKDLQYDSVLKNKAPSEETKPVLETVQEYSQCQLEAENADEQKSGTRLNSASILSNLSGNVTRSSISSSSSVRLLNPQTAEATNSSVVANKSCAQECKSKRSVSFPISVLHNATGKENATNPVVTKRKEMSIVASGLNQSEHLVVQKFAQKTRSTLSNRITEGTTHVIMKTDKELVCERTLKYFLGIAGRKWIVSYHWVIQSFKEGRILDEENFEVRGDVINGRNHQGPKRARQSLTEKIFKDFEICCYGPFTDMTTEHLEWMVELCGASVVKQIHLFTHTPNSTAVVVVQPDASMENTDYRAIQQKNNVAMVTREWVLDSVACYECQEFDAYLVS